MTTSNEDVLGLAVKNHYFEGANRPLRVQTSYGTVEEMGMDVLFREPEDFPDIEKFALTLAAGTVLDVGAGVGSHTLALQQEGFEVSALELSAGAAEVMSARGVEVVIRSDIFQYTESGYNTFVMLMNGIGLAGDIEGLRRLLHLLRKLAYPGAQIIFDSSDITYLYDELKLELPAAHYYGEVQFQFGYDDTLGEPFNWLYIDARTLKDIASSCGWQLQVVYEDDLDHYLGRLTLVPF